MSTEEPILQTTEATVSCENFTSLLWNINATVPPELLTACDVTDSDQPSTKTYVHLIVYIIIGVVGIIGNGTVIIVLTSSSRIREKIVNIFLINQSVLDFCTAVFLVATGRNDYSSSGHYGMSGELYCRLWSMKVPMWSTFMSSTYNLVALTLERYMEVKHPIQHRVSFTRHHAFTMIAIVWLIGPLYNFPLTGLTSTSIDGQCKHMTQWPNEATRMFCGVLTFVLEFFLPLGIMVVAYTRMAIALQTKVHPATTDNQNNKQEIQKRRARRNVIKTLVLVAVCFFLCWVWNQVFFLLFNLGYPSNFTTIFYNFTVYSAFISCCINPFVYTAQYRDFQKQAKKLFCPAVVLARMETTENSIN